MESFEECMERLFKTLASGKSWRSMNRLDLFKVIFEDQQKKIDLLERKIEVLTGVAKCKCKLCKALDKIKDMDNE